MCVPTQNPSAIAKKTNKQKNILEALGSQITNLFIKHVYRDPSRRYCFSTRRAKKKSSNEIYVRKTFQNRIKQHPL